jgi:ATP/maltotriose-dependent transcriptional regulator MalT
LLDEDDNNPARFLVYVLTALKTIEADNGDAELLT